MVVRVVGDGIEAKIVPIREALEIAQSRNKDLVEISPNSNPPVCKVIDYNKFKYEKLKKEVPMVKIAEYRRAEGEGFNFSNLINHGAEHSDGKYLLLLNNDTEVITRSWMEELLMFAQRKDTGAVGCKLYYGDYSIQHAGIVIGLGAHRTAGHTHYRLSKDNLGYMGRLW